jgi:hypothetical protein
MSSQFSGGLGAAGEGRFLFWTLLFRFRLGAEVFDLDCFALVGRADNYSMADDVEALFLLDLEEGGGVAIGVCVDVDDIEDGGNAHAGGGFVLFGEVVELVHLFGADEQLDVDPADDL